jgi:hypothetical protein
MGTRSITQPRSQTEAVIASDIAAAIKGLTRLARKQGVRLRQSYARWAVKPTMDTRKLNYYVMN